MREIEAVETIKKSGFQQIKTGEKSEFNSAEHNSFRQEEKTEIEILRTMVAKK